MNFKCTRRTLFHKKRRNYQNSHKILWEFAGVCGSFLNAQNEHFFAKKEEINKTPTRICGSFVGVCGSFSWIFKCKKRTLFYKKKRNSKNSHKLPGIIDSHTKLPHLSDVHWTKLPGIINSHKLPQLIMPSQKLPQKKSFFLTKKFIFALKI